jgi:DUF4097 and DUF4098 domain-containing protein YvlB
MKAIIALAGITVVVSSLAAAQEGNRLVIPPRNGAQARQVRIHSTNNAITVKAHQGQDVIVESAGVESEPADSHGMRRLDVPRGLSVEQTDNTIEIRTSVTGGGSPVTVLVPVNTSLDLHGMNGAIDVEGTHGEIVAHTLNGRINITGVNGTVLADNLNGGIHVSMDGVDQSKPLSFSTLNGTIDVTLPASVKADVHFKTFKGPIYSDFDVTMGGMTPTAEPDHSGQGKYKLRFDGTLQGRINGGGVQIDFRTLNAPIYLRKK